jgi:hypothetical protein
VVESVLLYGSEAWTLTKSIKKSINGTYTRMLRVVKGCICPTKDDKTPNFMESFHSYLIRYKLVG